MTDLQAQRKSSNEKETMDTPKDLGSVPSGFVLKLYQMVNGAPDEIISWIQSGDAFRISDLNRLENETLPTYFRHKRFQSLVRQLNFYNFRKVNRERNFWVYKHPLFHRDCPGDLHLLRRRTCPGVDGRKVRPEVELSTIEADFRSPSVSVVTSEGLSDSDGTNSDSANSKKRKARSSGSSKRQPDNILSAISEGIEDISKLSKPRLSRRLSDTIEKSDEATHDKTGAIKVEDFASVEDQFMRGPSRLVQPSLIKNKADLKEHSLMISKVARQLEEHARRAALSTGKGIKKRAGTVTPPYSSDTMRYHALTYDDEIEIYDSARGCVVERSSFGKKNTDADIDESDSQSENNASIVSCHDGDVESDADKHVVTAPVGDLRVIQEVIQKLHASTDQLNSESLKIAQLISAVAKFCMSTDPRDPTLGEKAIQLMSVHADLAHEFCRYKIALSPNNNLCLMDQHTALMKEIFQGESKETLRGFKTFVLNKLNDAVRQSKNGSWSETECLTQCYDVWFSAVAASA